MDLKIVSTSSVQTKELAKLLAKKILKTGSKEQAVVLALVGDLGSGKTTFVQGFARGLNIRKRILSPTYLIMRRFQIPSFAGKTKDLSNQRAGKPKTSSQFKGLNPENRFKKRVCFKHFFHLDCYRLKDPKELVQLGFADITKDPQNIVVIEWAERVEKILPKDRITLKFKFLNQVKREIKMSGYPLVDNSLLTSFVKRIKLNN